MPNILWCLGAKIIVNAFLWNKKKWGTLERNYICEDVYKKKYNSNSKCFSMEQKMRSIWKELYTPAKMFTRKNIGVPISENSVIIIMEQVILTHFLKSFWLFKSKKSMIITTISMEIYTRVAICCLILVNMEDLFLTWKPLQIDDGHSYKIPNVRLKEFRCASWFRKGTWKFLKI